MCTPRVKKLQLTREQWANLVHYIQANATLIKALLHSNMDPDMISIQAILTGAETNTINLHIELNFPRGDNRIVLYCVTRPTFTNSDVIDKLNALTLTDTLVFVANQIDIIGEDRENASRLHE